MLSIEVAATAMTFLFGLMTSILISGVPWAYIVHGRLTKIETTLSAYLKLIERLPDIERRLTRLEIYRLQNEQDAAESDDDDFEEE